MTSSQTFSTFVLTLLVTFSFGQKFRDLSFKFDNLKPGDTLFIQSQINDCGEFGGHLEYIKVFQDKTFVATFKWDKPCDEIKWGDPMQKYYVKKIELTSKTRSDILHFIDRYEQFYSDSLGTYCAMTDHKLAFANQSLSFIDYCYEFKAFSDLRDSLFLKRQ